MAGKASDKIELHDKHKAKIRRSPGDYVISFITYVVYAFFAFVCVYPFYYIIINSISANNLSDSGKVIFYPMEIHFTNYKNLANIPGLTTAAYISVLRTVIGTVLIVVVAAFLGYMFTRETLWKRKFWYRFVVATMYFNAGVIPWYLTMKLLGLTNNFWGYIFPMVVQPFYIILCKTYCESVPKELQDAGEIDGAGTLRIFFSIMLPVIKPILATIAIFTAVGQWNAWYAPMIYITTPTRQVMQVILRRMLIDAQTAALFDDGLNEVKVSEDSVKAVSILITILPIICTYPFAQKYFIKGLTSGAVKG